MTQKEKEGSVVVGRVSTSLGDSYWDRTDRIQAMGRTPQCCGRPMVAEDDHGRFVCFNCGYRTSL